MDQMNYFNVIDAVLGRLIPRRAMVALFDFPNHSNVGDSAIWLGEEAYLSSRACRVVRVGECRAGQALPSLPEEALVLVHGGGNFGDLWPHHQQFREQIIQHYPRNRIIQLPQSIHFREDSAFRACGEVLSRHRDFHLLVRDNESLELAFRLHDGPSSLCPDMALCLKPMSRTVPCRHRLVALLRMDKESNDYDVSALAGQCDVFATDWLEEGGSGFLRLNSMFANIRNMYPRWTFWLEGARPGLYHAVATERFRRGCDILSAGSAVLTDRLHGHIMCSLLGIPHVVLDNNYRKIGKFRDAWMTGGDMCATAFSLREALEKARALLDAHPVT